MNLVSLILFRLVLVGVTIAYSAVISKQPYHLPSKQLLWFITSYAVLGLLPLVWAMIRSATDWFETGQGTAVLRCTYVVDVLFLLTLAYAAGEGNDLWAAYFIPWGMVLVLSNRTCISVPTLDTILGIVLAVMILLTVWLTISAAAHSPVANALVLWGAFLEGWIILRCLAQERSSWIAKADQSVRELTSLRTLTQAVSTGLVLVENETVTAATGPSKELLGLERGEPLSKSSLPPEIIRRLTDLTGEGQTPLDLECPITTRDGSRLYVGISAFPVASESLGTLALVLEARKTSARREERLRQSNRLASVGQLAAGIAHELGNPIAIIKSCSSYLLESAGRTDRHAEELEIITREASRCEELLSRLKSLASGRQESARFDLRSSVQEAVLLVRYQVKDVQLHLSVPREHVPIFGDSSQMVAVLVNLLLNAAESMKDRPKEQGIQVTLEREKEQAVLEIRDHGRGMTPEERERIFDPFYTGRRDGTGLGLSIVQQVIEQMGGTIDVESALEEGTTFTITLPVMEED